MSNYDKLTIADIKEIKAAAKVKTIGEWKAALKEQAIKFGLTDREVIDIANGKV